MVTTAQSQGHRKAATPNAAIVAAQGLPVADADAAAVSDPALWIIESFAIVQNEVYTDLIVPRAGPFPLTQAYEERALVVARERAALVGARLAKLRTSIYPSSAGSER
jgi:hypothetical protein